MIQPIDRGVRRVRLTGPQQAAVLDTLLGRITEEELVTTLGADPRTDDGYLPELLAEAVRHQDADAAWAGLSLMFRFDRLSARSVAVLCDLLVADWHTRHEDVASALQQLSDPAAVPALRRAAELNFPYRDYDEVRALSRKCMWALSDIRTDEAVEALESLTQSHDAIVRDLAAYHLAKVRNGEPPSPGSRRVGGR